jgi:hypothetical protein
VSEAVQISAHALTRYMERTGSTRVVRSLNKLESMLASARFVRRSLSKKTEYFLCRGGWVLIVRERILVTLYKPNMREGQRLFYS